MSVQEADENNVLQTDLNELDTGDVEMTQHPPSCSESSQSGEDRNAEIQDVDEINDNLSDEFPDAEHSTIMQMSNSLVTDNATSHILNHEKENSALVNISPNRNSINVHEHTKVEHLQNGDNLTNSFETNSTGTETDSEEFDLSPEVKDGSGNLWNSISSLLNQGDYRSSMKCQKSNQVTGFILMDGSAININDKFLQQSIVTDIGNVVEAFLNKIKVNPDLSEMVFKTKPNINLTTTKEDALLNLSKTCKELEKNNFDLKLQIKELQEKLKSHDQSAKLTISRLQKDYETKLNELTKKCSVAESEKQSSVMNFARREKELLDLKKQKESAEQFAKAAGKEKDKVLLQIKQLKTDLSKLRNSHEKKESESSVRSKEVERLREEINSQTIKVRWAQNKLKSEVDCHKETKEKCEKMQLVIQQAKEETEQIRKNCQDMIKTYQESEEMKSNALDIELKEKKDYILKLENNLKDLQSKLGAKTEEVELLKKQFNQKSEENEKLIKEISDLNHEKNKNERAFHDYEEVLSKQKATALEMNEQMQQIFDLESKVENLNETIENLNTALHEAVVRRDAALNDVARKEKKEQELLEFTQKVSSKNSQLAVEVEQLNSKLATQETNIETYLKKINSLQDQVKELTASKEKEDQASMKVRTTMSTRLEDKEHAICQLLTQLEELKDELRTVKRKNAASIKDLTRQLNQVKRKADNAEILSSSSIPNSADGGSMGSRTSSVTSLDRMHAPLLVDSQNSQYCEHISVPETTVAGPDSYDRQILIERIVRLQQIHAKKNEKIDFLNEHIHQLVSALQKKQRLIQHYIMREEAGALAPSREHHDQKRHGLTLDLSIEINQKMQSVLEDTLLKNITLKESLETMGHEVQRLQSQTS